MRKTDGILLSTVLLLISIISAYGFGWEAPQSDSDPCLDQNPVNISTLRWPSKYSDLTPPWIRADGQTAKVTKSLGLAFGWSWMKALSVTGLKKTTVEDVIQFLSSNNCTFVPIGPSVRSGILKEKTSFLSGEVSCDLHDLHDKCISKFGKPGCSLYPTESGGWGTHRLEIGDAQGNRSAYTIEAEPIVLYEWRSLTGSPVNKWRFTVDTLAIFDDGAGGEFLIDLTGNGHKHLCEKKLSPPTDNWEEWSKEQPLKVISFYELKASGFSAKNESLQSFVNEEIKSMEKKTIQKFYCEDLLKGIMNQEGMKPICYRRNSDKNGSRSSKNIKLLMKYDLGDSWESTVGGAIEQLESNFTTNHQFAEVRARLLHKIESSSENTFTEKPVIIEEGKPVKEGRKATVEVDARPIPDMSTQAPNHDPPVEDEEKKSFYTTSMNDDLQLLPDSDPVYVQAEPVQIGYAYTDQNENEHNQKSNLAENIPSLRFVRVEEETPYVAAFPV